MGTLEIIIIAIALAMDAFVVSICKGVSEKKINIKKCFIIAIYFALFQALMPLFGYLLGTTFSFYVEKVDHYIAFILLSLIGINMIKESFKSDNSIDDKMDIKTLTILAVATSIDALTVGISFAFLDTNIYLSVLIIGIITFVLCFIGVIIGTLFKNKFGNKCGIIGGIVLIIMGLKILLEHLNII